MSKKVHLIICFIIGGFFLLADQILKYLARTFPETTHYLWHPWLGWEHLANKGIAFSLPFPNLLLLIFIPLIIISLLLWSIKKTKKNLLFHWALALTITGAISNFIDRLLFQATIDYLRLFTSVINLADVLIVGGLALLILNANSYKKLSKKNPEDT